MHPLLSCHSHCQYTLDEDDKTWLGRKEDENGEVYSSGEYAVLPLIPLRWYGIVGENYGN